MEVRIGGKFRLLELLNKKHASEVWKALDVINNQFVAVKIHKNKGKNVNREACVYQNLRGGQGIPCLWWHGIEGENTVVVIDLLGESLEKLMKKFKSFSLATVLRIGLAIISRISFMHSRNILHRDIKPESILLGIENKEELFVVDFSLAKSFMNSKNSHIKYSDNKKFVGSARYASINTHLGITHSRRDDLEVLGYVLMYFLKGKLPWQGMKAYTKKEKYDQITDKKLSTMINTLCEDAPREFEIYLEYVRSLRFDERPQYVYLQSLFKNVLERIAPSHFYEWNIKIREKAINYKEGLKLEKNESEEEKSQKR